MLLTDGYDNLGSPLRFRSWEGDKAHCTLAVHCPDPIWYLLHSLFEV